MESYLSKAATPWLLAPCSQWNWPFPTARQKKLKATGKAAWTRKRAERNLLFSGMGLQFIEIEEQAQKDLIELVEGLNRPRLSS